MFICLINDYWAVLSKCMATSVSEWFTLQDALYKCLNYNTKIRRSNTVCFMLTGELFAVSRCDWLFVAASDHPGIDSSRSAQYALHKSAP